MLRHHFLEKKVLLKAHPTAVFLRQYKAQPRGFKRIFKSKQTATSMFFCYLVKLGKVPKSLRKLDESKNVR